MHLDVPRLAVQIEALTAGQFKEARGHLDACPECIAKVIAHGDALLLSLLSPIYQHTGVKDKYLGHFKGADLYFGPNRAVLARFSDKPEDFEYADCRVPWTEVLNEAVRRTTQLGMTLEV